MIIAACSFTQNGRIVYEKLCNRLPDIVFKHRDEIIPLNMWTKDAFEKHMPVLFIAATGIAVRSIAPFVNDKLCDSPVIVIDEKGQYVISLLSGHMGGANEIALTLAKAIGGEPVITTATDVEGIFSIDVFARRNYLNIMNREGIKKVSSKLLKNEEAYIYFDGEVSFSEDEIPDNIKVINDKNFADIILSPKKYTLGIGCKKGKSFIELKEFVENCLEENNVDINDITAITSIDLKAREEGLNTLACFYHVPFITYSAEQLQSVEGIFTESVFVKEVTGVSNVCERAALFFERNGELIVKKTAKNGMTFAMAKHEGRIQSWKN